MYENTHKYFIVKPINIILNGKYLDPKYKPFRNEKTGQIMVRYDIFDEFLYGGDYYKKNIENVYYDDGDGMIYINILGKSVQINVVDKLVTNYSERDQTSDACPVVFKDGCPFIPIKK